MTKTNYIKSILRIQPDDRLVFIDKRYDLIVLPSVTEAVNIQLVFEIDVDREMMIIASDDLSIHIGFCGCSSTLIKLYDAFTQPLFCYRPQSKKWMIVGNGTVLFCRDDEIEPLRDYLTC